MLEQWAAKYGISEQFKLDFDEDAYYENVYRDIFKSKIDRYVRARPEIYHILLKIFNLLGDKDTAIEDCLALRLDLLGKLLATSDFNILGTLVKEISHLEDDDIAVIKSSGAVIYNNGVRVEGNIESNSPNNFPLAKMVTLALC
ncbi:hypothetical protein DINM_007358 [Dirofilaria immitis]|nr:hypothetical protein [Dirofilaria immitis]